MQTGKCMICGEEFMLHDLREVFTGRKRYLCPKCYVNGQREVDEHQYDWFVSTEGKRALKAAEEKRR